MKVRVTLLIECSDEWDATNFGEAVANGVENLGDEILEGSNIDVEIETVHLENAVRILG